MREPRKFHCLVCQKDRTTLGDRCPTCKSWVGIEDWIEPKESPKPSTNVGKSKTELQKPSMDTEYPDFEQRPTETNSIKAVDAA